MKTFRAKTGPFTERPYYELQEIEILCAEELRKVGLYPNEPSPIRIDRFIEKRFGISHEYEDLPEDVLGYTRFSPDGVERIVVAHSLAEEGSGLAERRINTTLAHEAGHSLLHAYLFLLDLQPQSLFDGLDHEGPRILCRDIGDSVLTVKRSYSGRWWEYQANLGMEALLLPRLLVEKALQPHLVTEGSFGGKTLERARREEAILFLAEIFDVNRIVAKIRLGEMYPDGAQLRL